MKARFLVLAGAALLLLNGCTNANSETEPAVTNVLAPAPTVVESPAKPAASATNPIPAIAVTTNDASVVAAKAAAEDEAAPAGEAVNTLTPPPANIKLSPAAGEVTKLVQAGVDSNVILAYVTNSPNTFRLEADDIVYLKDLGMAPEVVTAMIQHDQQIKNTAGSTTTTSTAPVSVWTAGLVAPSNDVWQTSEPAPAAQPSTATTVPPPPPSEIPAPETVNYFYDSLAPYGTWVDVDGYGRCWRPTVVVTTPGWRPYSHCGRWEWTDSGWYWYSDYSWGWAPFHYGRWFSHPRWGWCWVPGSVWGPSWVSWRYSDAYCGWSPLPPAAYYSPSIGFTYFGSSCGSGFSFGLTWDCFTFVSYSNFRHHRYDRDCVPHHQAGQVYNHTTVVNNIIRGNNNTIINQGIPPTRITAAGGGPIKQVNIRDTRGPRGNGGAIRHEQIAQDGNIKVIRPSIPTGKEHGTIGAVSTPTRGGAHGLVTGNGGSSLPIKPSAPSGGLVPPRVGGANPVGHNTIPPKGEPSAPSGVAQSPAGGSPTPPGSGSPMITPTVPGTGGIKPSRGAVGATPNQNGNPAPGSVIVRNPQTTIRGPKENAAAPGNNFVPPSVTPSAPTQPSAPIAQPPVKTPTSPAVVSTPGTIRPTRPVQNAPAQATPWLNNSPNTATTAPIKAPPSVNQSTPTRDVWSGTRETRSGNTWNNGNNNIRSTTPSAPSAPNYVAPTVRSTPAPSYQAPSTPPRVFGAPSAPQSSPSYSPPTRSAPQTFSAPSQPSYSAPTREAAPSRSYSPPRSEPRSAPSSSSSRGSDSSSKSSSKDNSRGR